MARLIDADALKKSVPNTHVDIFENCRNCELLDDEQVEELIDNASTIDAVPVVRCEDCKYWIELEHGTGTCKRLDNVLFWLGTDATDFCSFAERKDDG